MASKKKAEQPASGPVPMQLTRVAVADLLPDPANPNTHDEDDIRSLQAKLAAHDQVENLVVQAGTMIVCGGNGRLEAMRRLGWTHCDVLLKELSDVKFRELSIALNKRRSKFDETMLAQQIRALQSEGVESIALGYTDDEVDGLITGLADEILGAAGNDSAGDEPGRDDAVPPDDFAEKDESIETEYQCPKCDYRWSGKPG